MRIGYARVSTDSQDTDRQIQILMEAKAEKIFQEAASGVKWILLSECVEVASERV